MSDNLLCSPDIFYLLAELMQLILLHKATKQIFEIE